MAFKRWLYCGGHPNQLAKILNRGLAIIHAHCIGVYMRGIQFAGCP